jgi:hypothetical protein
VQGGGRGTWPNGLLCDSSKNATPALNPRLSLLAVACPAHLWPWNVRRGWAVWRRS